MKTWEDLSVEDCENLSKWFSQLATKSPCKYTHVYNHDGVFYLAVEESTVFQESVWDDITKTLELDK